ncbi:cap1-related protein [Phaffia rhodozyma]|uniref:Cap1-related protein n=1 Tax=Phaffia rhodozyma TaxID=264483 RepID=A0A0F7SH33_PHARH|nr:cap1-related protein [Phaffia rhodozyma]
MWRSTWRSCGTATRDSAAFNKAYSEPAKLSSYAPIDRSPQSPSGSTSSRYQEDINLGDPPRSYYTHQPPAQRFLRRAHALLSPKVLLSGRGITVGGVLGSVVLLWIILNLSGTSSKTVIPPSKRPAGYNDKAYQLLYYPEHPNTCRFQEPGAGLTKDELEVYQSLQAALSSPHKKPHSRWQGGIKLDLPTSPAVLEHEGEVSERSHLGYKFGLDGNIHPIFSLLAWGEEKFAGMVQRRSESLEEAVSEYKKRYGRNPPRGFDKWWDYATKNNVLLPDEYDSIEDSLAPFRAFTRRDLLSRLEEAKSVRDTVILRHRRGTGTSAVYTAGLSENDYWTNRRSDGQLLLIPEEVRRVLPDFDIVFGLKDEPQVLSDWETKAKLYDLSAHNEKLPENSPLPYASSRLLFPNSCSPSTPLRQGLPEEPSHLAFISPESHRRAQDPCLHPYIADNHGFLIDEKGEWTNPVVRFGGKLLPLLCLSKVEGMTDLGGIPFEEEGFDLVSKDKTPWSSKDEKLYWRGQCTGLFKSKGHGHRWRQSHRARLHKMVNDPSTLKTVPVLLTNADSGEAKTEVFSPTQIREWGYDISLSGKAVQCDQEDGTCADMDQVFKFAPLDSQEKANNHKYLFDIDGNAWTSRFRRLMMSNSLVFKSTIFPEWNTDILPEWFAYVPIKMDYTDTPSVLAFFRGSPPEKGSGSSWPSFSAEKGLRDEVAKRMADNGRCWVERTWRKEDMVVYMYRFYLEWARLVHEDRGDLEMAD